MKPDPADEKRALQALEAELRQDRLDDPGDEFFADLERRVLREADQRPAPRRPWWRAGGLGNWLWRPAPLAALAGAAAVALVVLWVGGPGGPSGPSGLREISTLQAPGLRPGPPPRAGLVRPTPGEALQGDAWFAALPPTEDLWAVEDKDLPVLLALVSAEVGDGDEDPGATPEDPVGEQSLRGLSEAELQVLERLLDQQQRRRKRPRNQKRPRPRPTMGQTG